MTSFLNIFDLKVSAYSPPSPELIASTDPPPKNKHGIGTMIYMRTASHKHFIPFYTWNLYSKSIFEMEFVGNFTS